MQVGPQQLKRRPLSFAEVGISGHATAGQITKRCGARGHRCRSRRAVLLPPGPAGGSWPLAGSRATSRPRSTVRPATRAPNRWQKLAPLPTRLRRPGGSDSRRPGLRGRRAGHDRQLAGHSRDLPAHEQHMDGRGAAADTHWAMAAVISEGPCGQDRCLGRCQGSMSSAARSAAAKASGLPVRAKTSTAVSANLITCASPCSTARAKTFRAVS
jgi:hypothetical protein